MFNFYFRLSILLLSVLCRSSSAQTINNDSLLAFNYLANEDYNRALKQYFKLYINNKEDYDINYNIGYCYLHINDDKTNAVSYLEPLYTKGGYKDDLLLNLGIAYMHAYRFDEALKLFTDYRKIIYSKKFELIENYYEDVMEGRIDYQKKITTKNYGLVDHCIENCENAKELIKSPLNVTFENLGPAINSKYADYNPFVTQDQSTLYFTSRRDENRQKEITWQGYYSSDIYFSTVEKGEWGNAENIGSTINSKEDEECIFVSTDGKKMIVYEENGNVAGDLFVIPLDNMNSKPVNFKEPVNTQFGEFQACLSADENTVVISSDRPGGLGGKDLYILKKLANNEWSAPSNLGPLINTQYDEAFPMLDEKNNILYFASQGHVNMGGYDIFSSELDTATQSFGQAANIGYPINTPDDNLVYTLAENKRDGYISAVRKDGVGDLDIYKVTFNDVESRPSIIRGVVAIGNSDTLRKGIIASVSLRDAKTNKILDSKNVNPQSGRYVFAVLPGKYILTVTSIDFPEMEEKINVYDKSDYVFEIEKNYFLQKPSIPDSSSANPASNSIDVNTLSVKSAADSVAVAKAVVVDSTTIVSSPEINIKETNNILMLRGIVTFNDNYSGKKGIDAIVYLKEMNTNTEVGKKNVNVQNGKYFFSVKPGNYLLTVSSPGYEKSEQEITLVKSDIYEIEKNVQLIKSETPVETLKELETPAAKSAVIPENKKVEVTVPKNKTAAPAKKKASKASVSKKKTSSAPAPKKKSSPKPKK
ncbi:MAG: hypothetical protein V4608_08530 [Bacteroidota bacterium]